MEPPTKFKDARDNEEVAKARPFARSALVLTAIYAVLTLVSWEALKRAFSWLSSAAGSPSILTSYIGDVRIYTHAPGAGGGNLTDIGQPWRATIRRRMINQLVAMGERDYDRWYILGHSLGSVVAWNGVQETEWNLPNYLDLGQVKRIQENSHTNQLWLATPPAKGEPIPDLTSMMPRRPVWLGDNDRISRKVLFKTFGGLITYGSPLDKFAALWPRIVPVNKQRDCFPSNADWINLSDATDPVGANIEAFEQGWREEAPETQSPVNIRVKASALFLFAHIRYFGMPSKGKQDCPESRALVDVLFPTDGQPKRLSVAFASVGDHYGSRFARMALAISWIIGLGVALVVGASWLALLIKKLGDAAFGSGPFESAWQGLVGFLGLIPIAGFAGTMVTTIVWSVAVVFLAGLWRNLRERADEGRKKPTPDNCSPW